MAERKREIEKAGQRSRERYYRAHGYYPEDRAEQVRYHRVNVALTGSQFAAMKAAARAAGLAPADYLARLVLEAQGDAPE